LKSGDLTLLGIITDGGHGLTTGDNGSFVGVIDNHKMAKRILQTRPIKLMEAVEGNPKIRDEFEIVLNCEGLSDYQNLLNSLSEQEIRDLFDSIKEMFGLRVFGKGFLYRIVKAEEVYDVALIKNEEKKKGIDLKTETYVPYDKGDKDGNRWYLETPFRINWTNRSINKMKALSGHRWDGSNFFFNQGFCWNDILNPFAVYIKSRLKNRTINDVKSMSLYDQSGNGDKFFVAILNSFLVFKLIREFFNSTVSLQINDLRKLPIKIPTPNQLEVFNDKFDHCFDIKKRQFAEELSEAEALALLKPIELEIDKLVEELYGINDE
jgi:hypothetical protein